MVEKIDRPNRRNPYEIREAKQTKEDQHYQHNPRDEAEKQYKKQLEGKEWSKFGSRAMVIKPIRVPRENIRQVLYRNVQMFKGIGILQSNVIWKDGRKTAGALFRLARLEDFFHLKKFAPNQPVPEQYWARGPTVELGIPQMMGGSGPFPMSNESMIKNVNTKKEDDFRVGRILSKIGLFDIKSKTVSWGMLAFYLLILLVIGITLYYEFS
ncbi:MAG: hypothetical protein HN337_06940 [Deltaproteobacteria bacterium]|nr:hypothetical protein [Deltaproteobacteria bacterium]